MEKQSNFEQLRQSEKSTQTNPSQPSTPLYFTENPPPLSFVFGFWFLRCLHTLMRHVSSSDATGPLSGEMSPLWVPLRPISVLLERFLRQILTVLNNWVPPNLQRHISETDLAEEEDLPFENLSQLTAMMASFNPEIRREVPSPQTTTEEQATTSGATTQIETPVPAEPHSPELVILNTFSLANSNSSTTAQTSQKRATDEIPVPAKRKCYRGGHVTKRGTWTSAPNAVSMSTTELASNAFSSQPQVTGDMNQQVGIEIETVSDQFSDDISVTAEYFSPVIENKGLYNLCSPNYTDRESDWETISSSLDSSAELLKQLPLRPQCPNCKKKMRRLKIFREAQRPAHNQFRRIVSYRKYMKRKRAIV